MAVDLKDPETKAAIQSAVDAAVAEATAGMTEKNKQILDELKKARKGQQIDPADHAALQQELDQAQAKLTEATKQAKAAITEAEKVKKAYETESKVTHNLLVKTGLTQALIAAKVKPELMDAVEALLSGSVVLTADGENRVAKMGDKPLTEAVAEWAKSEKGRHFVAAPANGGGGALGGGGEGGGKKTMTRTAFDALTPAGQMDHVKSGGTVTAA